MQAQAGKQENILQILSSCQSSEGLVVFLNSSAVKIIIIINQGFLQKKNYEKIETSSDE